MDPVTFRRDRWLRTSASHLATWSLAGLVLELRRAAVLPGTDAAAAAVIVGAGFLTSMTHGRRIAKMVGPAGEPVFARAGMMWRLLLSGLAAATVVLLAADHADELFKLWMFVAGAGFAAWGWAAGFGWYAGVGLAMAASAALEAVLAPGGNSALALRCVMLGVVLPGCALVTNRRYLWFRPRLSH